MSTDRQDDIDGLDEINRLYDCGGNDSQPPAQLDEAILRAAHEATQHKPRKQGRRRFDPPLAIAAMLLLSIGLVTVIQQDIERKIPLDENTEEAVPKKETRQQDGPAVETISSDNITPPPIPTMPSPTAPARATTPAAAEAKHLESQHSKRKVAEYRQQTSDARMPSGPAEGPPSTSPATVGAIPRDVETAQDIGDEAGIDAATSAVGFETTPIPSTPEAWLERIRELIEQQNIDAARNAYAEFRKHHPHYAVPAELDKALQVDQP